MSCPFLRSERLRSCHLIPKAQRTVEYTEKKSGGIVCVRRMKRLSKFLVQNLSIPGKLELQIQLFSLNWLCSSRSKPYAVSSKEIRNCILLICCRVYFASRGHDGDKDFWRSLSAMR
ncbi:hypothetical protein CFP56_031009 [Quercus suber]|uniref:Uncharacterized protein n=1 Tax=Quercus suber TaxID=58331 RepID=A0AAW0JM70_QUESU